MMGLTTESLSADPWSDVVGTAPSAEGLQNQFRIVLGADGNLVALRCKKDDETGAAFTPTESASADPWKEVAGSAPSAEGLQNEILVSGENGVVVAKCDKTPPQYESMFTGQVPAAPEGAGSLMLEQTVIPAIEA